VIRGRGTRQRNWHDASPDPGNHDQSVFHTNISITEPASANLTGDFSNLVDAIQMLRLRVGTLVELGALLTQLFVKY
jgi:hypothetical protein